MNETRGNARNKPMRGGLKGGEMNSLKDSEKTNELKIKGCLLHNSDLWETPKDLYNHYIKELKCFDVCPKNPNFDGLQIEWKKLNYCNPPYSQITKWVDKAIIEMKKGNTTHLLLPARTDTNWFYKLTENNVNIIFIKGRLHFNESKNSAPFPSMIVIIGPFIYEKGHTSYCVYTKDDINRIILNK